MSDNDIKGRYARLFNNDVETPSENSWDKIAAALPQTVSPVSWYQLPKYWFMAAGLVLSIGSAVYFTQFNNSKKQSIAAINSAETTPSSSSGEIAVAEKSTATEKAAQKLQDKPNSINNEELSNAKLGIKSINSTNTKAAQVSEFNSAANEFNAESKAVSSNTISSNKTIQSNSSTIALANKPKEEHSSSEVAILNSKVSQSGKKQRNSNKGKNLNQELSSTLTFHKRSNTRLKSEIGSDVENNKTTSALSMASQNKVGLTNNEAPIVSNPLKNFESDIDGEIASQADANSNSIAVNSDSIQNTATIAKDSVTQAAKVESVSAANKSIPNAVIAQKNNLKLSFTASAGFLYLNRNTDITSNDNVYLQYRSNTAISQKDARFFMAGVRMQPLKHFDVLVLAEYQSITNINNFSGDAGEILGNSTTVDAKGNTQVSPIISQYNYTLSQNAQYGGVRLELGYCTGTTEGMVIRTYASSSELLGTKQTSEGTAIPGLITPIHSKRLYKVGGSIGYRYPIGKHLVEVDVNYCQYSNMTHNESSFRQKLSAFGVGFRFHF